MAVDPNLLPNIPIRNQLEVKNAFLNAIKKEVDFSVFEKVPSSDVNRSAVDLLRPTLSPLSRSTKRRISHRTNDPIVVHKRLPVIFEMYLE
jgi:hypothetical protein